MDRRKLLVVVAAVVAVLGVALVFVYAKGADKRAAEKFDTVEVLVATKKIVPGENFDEALEKGKFELADVAQAQVLEGADNESDQFEGSVALTTLYPGEQLVPTKFGGVFDVEAQTTLPIPDGKVAISILVNDDGRVGKFLAPGAEVAVIFTDIDPTTQEPILTTTLLKRVMLLAAGSTSSISGANENTSAEDAPEAESEEAIQQLLTIAVSQRDAERVRFAEKDGELTAALLNGASDTDDTTDGVVKDTLLQVKD
ncbi:Flp pilus assembly protein CpaB [Nocardioides bizhenqiangii]|uniref:Flp pilus assembly protein CpaB n=1 Tax=Nocardioides bizhenqiangii TaxID=3095076 RepID=A0ABZ0ZL31_9ACTN|nr:MULTISPECIES: Flp pilus assembly protein CpaB [unclassified Nocardioides]MDZ5620697.1 Flp pilus assembly protein CpaB [Nocardioides sp. HM23]WQQ25063.1 Flp pilus assembly protein CpaB [Nocardioides sp. HM61]